MRITLLLLISIAFALNAFGQDAEHFQKDRDGNVIAILGSQDSVSKDLIQKGVENLFFIYTMQDSSASNIQAIQAGYSNQILSINSDGKRPLLQRFHQNGERNRINVLQLSPSDSTVSSSNKIDIRQKGSGNSVTITQQ